MTDSDDQDYDNDDFFDEEADVDYGGVQDDEESSDDGLLVPGFMKLPPELRRLIWEHYCPDVVSRDARVMEVMLGVREDNDDMWLELCPTLELEQRSTYLRRLGAIHKETRAMVLQACPDTLPLQSDALVRYNRSIDVVYVPDDKAVSHFSDGDVRVPSSLHKIRNIALTSLGGNAHSHLEGLDDLSNIYYIVNGVEESKRHLKWCTSPFTTRYYSEWHEKDEAAIDRRVRRLFCWPNPNHPYFNRVHVHNPPSHWSSAMEAAGLQLAPMVLFDLEEGFKRYDYLDSLSSIPVEEWSSSDEDAEDLSEVGNVESADEYESDGIDDQEVHDSYDSSEEEALMTDDEDDANETGRTAEAAFSSLEPEEQQPSLTRRPKRRIVDSDEESDGYAHEPQTKRARTARPVVLDSDEEDGGPPTRNTTQRSATLDNDSDDEPVGATRRRNRATVDESGSEGEPAAQSSDSGQEDDASEQSLSLAQRIAQPRGTNPVPIPLDSDEEEADDSSDGGDSFVAGGRYANEDEDEDEDEDEEEDSEDGGGMFNAAADESENDDRDASEEDGW